MKLLVILKEMAFMRIVLLIAAILFNIFIPSSGTHESYAGTDAFFNTVIPSLVPLLFMVLLLDALMSRVMIDGKDEHGRMVARRNSYISLGLAFSLVVFWSAYFVELVS